MIVLSAVIDQDIASGVPGWVAWIACNMAVALLALAVNLLFEMYAFKGGRYFLYHYPTGVFE